MSVVVMRDEVRRAYPGRKWQEKVEHMSEQQVIAVYRRLINQGRIRA